MNEPSTLSPNQLTIIALAVEYCQVVEQARQADSRHEFVVRIQRLLTRIYTAVFDLSLNDTEHSPEYIDDSFAPTLDEAAYDQAREAMATLMAEEDIYLETFVEDMRYSDTPIAQSLSENLADLYQEFFDFAHAAEMADVETQHALLSMLCESFRQRWGQTLCNSARALHAITFSDNNDY